MAKKKEPCNCKGKRFILIDLDFVPGKANKKGVIPTSAPPVACPPSCRCQDRGNGVWDVTC